MVSQLIDDNPDNFVSFSIQGSLNQPWGNSREAFYSVSSDGWPWFAIDGLADAWPISNYVRAVENRMPVPTSVTIDLTATLVSGDDTYDVVAEFCLEAGGTPTAATTYMIQVLDHYPTTQSYYRNCFMQAAPELDIDLLPGECQQMSHQFVLDATSVANIDDLKFMAWAQTPAAGIPAEVFQAQQILWPFVGSGEIFADGFESGDISAWVQ